jgi:hypothetical protein
LYVAKENPSEVHREPPEHEGGLCENGDFVVNRENILKVAQAIEDAARPEAEPEIGFNMTMYVDRYAVSGSDRTGHNCGTTACIAGWAWHIAKGRVPDEGSYYVREEGAEFLGLEVGSRTERDLFCPIDVPDHALTPARAAAVLRHLAETGKVDWSVGSKGEFSAPPAPSLPSSMGAA